MMSSKGAATVSCPGFSSGAGGAFLPPTLAFLSDTSPSLSALLGLCAEAGPSGATSATRYEFSEWVFNASHVVTPLKFVDVQRKISGTDFVEAANDPALDEGPEAFNVLSMDRADNVFTFGVVDDFVRVTRRQTAITDPLIRYEQGHFLGYGLPYKPLQRGPVNALDYAGDDLAFAADRTDDRN